MLMTELEVVPGLQSAFPKVRASPRHNTSTFHSHNAAWARRAVHYR